MSRCPLGTRRRRRVSQAILGVCTALAGLVSFNFFKRDSKRSEEGACQLQNDFEMSHLLPRIGQVSKRSGEVSRKKSFFCSPRGWFVSPSTTLHHASHALPSSLFPLPSVSLALVVPASMSSLLVYRTPHAVLSLSISTLSLLFVYNDPPH